MSDEDSVSLFLHELEREKNKGVNINNLPKKSLDKISNSGISPNIFTNNNNNLNYNFLGKNNINDCVK